MEQFWQFIINNKVRRIKFILLLLTLLILPTQNYYTRLEAAAGNPVIRTTDTDLVPLSFYPVNFTKQPAPWLSAGSALVIDVPSKTVIYAKNPDQTMLPASTTKIMTALVAMDYYKPDDVLDVKSAKAIGQTMKLVENEKITFNNLLYGLLVQSGNDAAEVLAEDYPGGFTSFVSAMNTKAKTLHLEKTNFNNPTGIDSFGHVTTAHDLAILASVAMTNATFAQIVGTASVAVKDVSGTFVHELTNINQLVGKVLGVKGVKTGWTEDAGECLVAYTERDKGKIISVVLGSSDRFKDTENLIDWVYNNFTWETTNSIQQ